MTAPCGECAASQPAQNDHLTAIHHLSDSARLQMRALGKIALKR